MDTHQTANETTKKWLKRIVILTVVIGLIAITVVVINSSIDVVGLLKQMHGG